MAPQAWEPGLGEMRGRTLHSAVGSGAAGADRKDRFPLGDRKQ